MLMSIQWLKTQSFTGNQHRKKEMIGLKRFLRGSYVKQRIPIIVNKARSSTNRRLFRKIIHYISN